MKRVCNSVCQYQGFIEFLAKTASIGGMPRNLNVLKKLKVLIGGQSDTGGQVNLFALSDTDRQRDLDARH